MLLFAAGVTVGVALTLTTKRALRWALPRAARWHLRHVGGARVQLEGPYTERRP